MFDHAAEQARGKAAKRQQLLQNKRQKQKTARRCAGCLRVAGPCKRCRPSAGEEEHVEDEIFDVEYLVRKKKANGSCLWLVKWQGYPFGANTWEPEENLSNDLLEDFAKRTSRVCRFCTKTFVNAAGRKSHEKAHQALELNPIAKMRRLKAGRSGAEEEGGKSKKAPVADGRCAEAASKVMQFRNEFPEISAHLGRKMRCAVSGRAAKDKELFGQVLVLLGSSNAEGSGKSVDVCRVPGEGELDGDESSASLEL